MATLSVGFKETFSDRQVTDRFISSSLCTWLNGNWALLFSHPGDFSCRDLESDRWLVVLQQTFAVAAVRPLGLVSGMSSHGANWVTEVGGSSATVLLEESPRRPFELHAWVLRDAVSQASSRFAMIIDESLRLRRTFAYTLRDQLPSPIDLAEVAGKLRREARWPSRRPDLCSSMLAHNERDPRLQV